MQGGRRGDKESYLRLFFALLENVSGEMGYSLQPFG